MPPMPFIELMEQTLTARRAKQPNVRSPHEGLALIEEECFELKIAVLKRQFKYRPEKALKG